MESTYVVYEPSLVAEVEAMLERDLARARPAEARGAEEGWTQTLAPRRREGRRKR